MTQRGVAREKRHTQGYLGEPGGTERCNARETGEARPVESEKGSHTGRGIKSRVKDAAGGLGRGLKSVNTIEECGKRSRYFKEMTGLYLIVLSFWWNIQAAMWW